MNGLGKQQDTRKIGMRFKLPGVSITSKIQKLKNDSLITSKAITTGTSINSLLGVQSALQSKNMHFRSGLTKRRLLSSMSSLKGKRETQESSMKLTTLSRYRAGTYAGCMLRTTCGLSHKMITERSPTNLVEEIVRYSVETRRVKDKEPSSEHLDMEKILTGNQASSAGGAATARTLASLEAWIGAYTSLGTGTAQTTPGFSGSTVLAATDSTVTGAFVVSALKTGIAAAWTAGGDPGIIMVGGTQKQVVSGFAGIATIYREAGTTAKGTAIVGAADLYISDFGEHRVVPNRFSRNRTCLILDMDYWAVAYLRKVSQKEIARTGGSEKRFIDVEYTLVSRNDDASYKVTDLS